MDFKEFFSMSQYVSRGDNKFNSVGCTSSYSVSLHVQKKQLVLLVQKVGLKINRTKKHMVKICIFCLFFVSPYRSFSYIKKSMYSVDPHYHSTNHHTILSHVLESVFYHHTTVTYMLHVQW